MLQAELSIDAASLVMDWLVILVILSTLIWLAIHILFDRGRFGPWPPSNRLTRILVWIVVLWPWTVGFGLAGVVLVLSIMVPPLDPQLTSFFYLLEASNYPVLIFLASLIFFRVLRWCWRGYGVAGVMVIVSTLYSTSMVFWSAGWITTVGYDILDSVLYGWRVLAIMIFCWFREVMKLKDQTESETFVMLGHSRQEIAMKSIYNAVIPLVRRIRIDKDESALFMLKNILQFNSDMEKSITLACSALGFNRSKLIHSQDVEDALVVVENVNTKWGTYNRLDFCILLVISIIWTASVLLSVPALLNNALTQYPVFFILDITLPIGIVILLSLATQRKPGRDYDLAKRHNESFRFTASEFKKRRMLDLLVVVIALMGATGVTVSVIISGFLHLGPLLFGPLYVLYILCLAFTYFDDFLQGQHSSPEELLIPIRKQLEEKITHATEETTKE